MLGGATGSPVLHVFCLGRRLLVLMVLSVTTPCCFRGAVDVDIFFSLLLLLVLNDEDLRDVGSSSCVCCVHFFFFFDQRNFLMSDYELN